MNGMGVMGWVFALVLLSIAIDRDAAGPTLALDARAVLTPVQGCVAVPPRPLLAPNPNVGATSQLRVASDA